MKKTVAAAVAAAFVVGASTTTFAAAANPFSDVPQGHWAYDSIAKLASQGIIEGYGDNTFRGDRNITRYEMAQMIAKAMAKNPTGVTKAELDRLAAEFRDELEALGVRVDELEKYADKVVWTGELRYRYWNTREDIKGGGKDKSIKNQLQMRLFPTATVNNNWKLKARMTATADMRRDTSGNFKLTYGYAEGTYGKLQINLGKMPFYTDVDDGLVMDDFFSGAKVTYGDKFKVAVAAGRWNLENANVDLDRGGYKYVYHLATGDTLSLDDAAASYQGIELMYGSRDNFFIGAGYHHFRSDDLGKLPGYLKSNKRNSDKNANIWAVGASYNFGGNVTLAGAFAKNQKADEFSKAYNVSLDYKGADRKDAGSWGIGAAYRYVGQNVSFAPTYDVWDTTNKRGVDIYVSWAPLANTYTQINYFTGKTLDTKEKTRTFFGRVSWFF
ncbi:MAG: S-layer homology domain-containing protein [Selenomonadaceae bacterium]|nr:S-layer homology domain-containing protein [Selenomonadaceae bacterium]